MTNDEKSSDNLLIALALTFVFSQRLLDYHSRCMMYPEGLLRKQM